MSKCHTNLSVLFLMMTCKATIISIKISDTGTSLAVQWLRLCASNAEGTGSIPDQGTKIPHFGCKVQPKKKKIQIQIIKTMYLERGSLLGILLWNRSGFSLLNFKLLFVPNKTQL